MLNESYASVRQYLRQAHSHRKQLRGHSGHTGEFQCGDRVWLYVPVVKRGQSKKLTSFWRGPYTVIHKTSAVNYCIQLIRTSRSLVVHYNRLKLCYGEPDQHKRTSVQIQSSPNNRNAGKTQKAKTSDRSLTTVGVLHQDQLVYQIP